MKKSKRSIIIICAGAVILLVGIAILASYALMNKRYGGETVRIYVPNGATEEALLDSLNTRLGGFGDDVYKLWTLQNGKVENSHGSYVVEPGTKAIDLSRRLKYGRQTPLNLTFNNIRTINELASRLSEKMEWGAEDFMQACDSVLIPKGFNRLQYAAAFLPDTYEFYWTATATDVVKRLSVYRDRFWNDERRQKAASMGLNPVKVATLASIAEEETAKKDERGKVARLYLNRLNKNMMLQADPTVKFAVGDYSIKRILNKHLTVDSPFNTYKYQGLPPGPIRMPEKATLEAVLNAPVHNYLYMCAKEDFSGYHNFTADYATHQANAARYRQALNRRGIK